MAVGDVLQVIEGGDGASAVRKQKALANLPSADEKDALDGAASPSSSNVFATMADVGGGGGGSPATNAAALITAAQLFR
jgi:hypothetical protein